MLFCKTIIYEHGPMVGRHNSSISIPKHLITKHIYISYEILIIDTVIPLARLLGRVRPSVVACYWTRIDPKFGTSVIYI